MANGYHPRLETDPVWWNGSNINSFTTASSVGIRTVTLYGWDDRPDVRDVRESRPGQDGEYADNLYLGGRTITLEGEVYGSSWVDLQARKRALAAVVQPSSAEVLLKVPDPATASPTAVYASTGMTGYERVSARVIEAIQFGETMDPLCQTWQVIVRASDPRVYSDVETSTDSGTTGTDTRSVAATSGGTYDTPTTITATGPTGSSWSVVSSDTLRLDMAGIALGASESVAFDTKDRLATLTSTYLGQRTRRGGLVALWPLNETSGTTADNAEGTAAYDGTYSGGYTLNQAGPGSGVPSVAFNGTSGVVTRTYVAALNPAQSTYEVWFKPSGAPQPRGVLGTLDAGVAPGSYTGFLFGWGYGGISSLFVGPNASEKIVGTFPAGEWTQAIICLDYTADTYAVYINGALAVSGTQTGMTPATSKAFTIGKCDVLGFFSGSIGPVALFNRALTGVEALALYQAKASTSTASAYSYLAASTSRWDTLGASSETLYLLSSGLTAGSMLNVKARGARL